MSRAKGRGEPTATDTMPMRFGSDARLWASWLYYEEGLTQNEIAVEMGISRPTVNTYLSEARDAGIVDISISYNRMRGLSLAAQLSEHFGLEDCLVIPTHGGKRSLIDRLGSAGAQVMHHLLRSGMTVAITWGRTVHAVAAAMEYQDRLRDVSVVQAIGSITERVTVTPDACATLMADRLRARYVTISAPAFVSSNEVRDTLLQEPVIAEQVAHFERLDCALFGVSSLRTESTLRDSGLIDDGIQNHPAFARAVGAISARLIDSQGAAIASPSDERIIGMPLASLRRAKHRIAVAGSVDKVPAILAMLRGGYATRIVTDADTATGLLRADGAEPDGQHATPRWRSGEKPNSHPAAERKVKKFLNAPRDAVKESLTGAISAFPGYLRPLDDDVRALASCYAKEDGKVGLLIGGGAGHEPCFIGYLGKGLADTAVVGSVFASPPPDRILRCTEAADRGAGMLYVYGNYTGDSLNFSMASDMALKKGIDVRTIETTDDAAFAVASDRSGRRGIAGNVFVFKIAGAAAERGYTLDECERLARKANEHCYSMGIALYPCSLPESSGPNFDLGPAEIEVGVGIHGEPGITREPMSAADDIADRVMDRLIDDAMLGAEHSVALLVNSLGATPMMELFILANRASERLSARGVQICDTMVGSYCTSLNMVGASISVLVLDRELENLYNDPCNGFALRRY